MGGSKSKEQAPDGVVVPKPTKGEKKKIKEGTKKAKKAKKSKANMLDLSGHALRTIPKEVLKTPTLIQLNVSKNALTYLPEDTAVALGSLEVLDISHNRFHSLGDCVGELYTLKTLIASHNALKAFPKVLTGLAGLTKLDLSHNALTALPDPLSSAIRAGKLGSSLRSLSLANNKLSSLPLGFASGCPSLTMLDVSCNRLASVPDDLGEMGSLRTLNLAKNKFDSVPPQVLEIQNLYALGLSGNTEIEDLPTALGHMPELADVGLNSCPLSQLPEELTSPPKRDWDAIADYLRSRPDSDGEGAGVGGVGGVDGVDGVEGEESDGSSESWVLVPEDGGGVGEDGGEGGGGGGEGDDVVGLEDVEFEEGGGGGDYYRGYDDDDDDHGRDYVGVGVEEEEDGDEDLYARDAGGRDAGGRDAGASMFAPRETLGGEDSLSAYHAALEAENTRLGQESFATMPPAAADREWTRTPQTQRRLGGGGHGMGSQSFAGHTPYTSSRTPASVLGSPPRSRRAPSPPRSSLSYAAGSVSDRSMFGSAFESSMRSSRARTALTRPKTPTDNLFSTPGRARSPSPSRARSKARTRLATPLSRVSPTRSYASPFAKATSTHRPSQRVKQFSFSEGISGGRPSKFADATRKPVRPSAAIRSRVSSTPVRTTPTPSRDARANPLKLDRTHTRSTFRPTRSSLPAPYDTSVLSSSAAASLASPARSLSSKRGLSTTLSRSGPIKSSPFLARPYSPPPRRHF